jgi:hypothetical protein
MSGDRFWKKVERGNPNECWPWVGALTSSPYGHRYGAIRWDGKLQGAHRVSYQIHTGPIPDGMGWEPGVRFNPESGAGEVVTEPLPAGEDPAWEAIFEHFGLDSDRYEVVPPVEMRSWESWANDGDGTVTRWLWPSSPPSTSAMTVWK